MRKILHKHHIVPRYMGGTDDPDNLVELTIEEHAEAHRILYEQHGRWQDKVAWQGLAGLMDHQDILNEMYDARKGSGNTFYGKKHSEESKRKMSESKKGQGLGIPKNHGDKIKEFWKDKDHANKGKTPWNKGKSCPASMESKIKKSKPVLFNGAIYYGIKEAARANNTSEYYVKQSCEYISK